MRIRRVLTILVAVCLLPIPAVGQNEPDRDAAEKTVVSSQKSARDLRKDLWRAEKDFYAIYNELNEDGLYDVVCAKEAPTGSVLKTQVCRPKFLARAIKEGKIGKGTNLESNSDIKDDIATFRSKLNKLVAASPELQSAAATLNQAHALVNADKERRARN